jgi:hypothetical protein
MFLAALSGIGMQGKIKQVILFASCTHHCLARKLSSYSSLLVWLINASGA